MSEVSAPPGEEGEAARVAVYAPSLLLSVTVERSATGTDELHVHTAGQGYWVARMLAMLGAAPVLCTTAAGEIGEVAKSRVDERVVLRAIPSSGTTGSYVDDRRAGERSRLAEVGTTPIDRHAVDDLGAVTMAEGIRAGIVVLTGTNLHGSIHPEVFERLAGNLGAVGVKVVADLSGAELEAVVRGHADAIKVSYDELAAAGLAAGPGGSALLDAARALHARSGAAVFVTCAADGVLAVDRGGALRATSPALVATEPRGAGDSFTAAVAYSLRHGADLAATLRLGVAAAAANVMRHGLGSGEHELIDAIASTVVVTPLP